MVGALTYQQLRASDSLAPTKKSLLPLGRPTNPGPGGAGGEAPACGAKRRTTRRTDVARARSASGTRRSEVSGAGGNRTRVLQRRSRSSPGAVRECAFLGPGAGTDTCADGLSQERVPINRPDGSRSASLLDEVRVRDGGDARSDPSITAQAARAKSVRLALALMVSSDRSRDDAGSSTRFSWDKRPQSKPISPS